MFYNLFFDSVDQCLETIPGFSGGRYDLIGRQYKSISSSITNFDGVRVNDTFSLVIMICCVTRCDIYAMACVKDNEEVMDETL